MHRDPKQWAYVRRLILEEGQSRRGLSRKTGLSRNTIRKMLKSPQPPHRALPPNSVDRKLIESAYFLAAERLSTDPSAYRRRTLYLWSRARDLVLKLDRRRGAALLREIAELVSGNTISVGANAGAGMTLSRRGIKHARGVADRDWMDRLLRGGLQAAKIEALRDVEGLALLLARIKSGPLRERHKAVAVLAHRRGVPIRTIAGHLSVSRASIRKYIRAFGEGGAEILFAHRKRIGRRAQDEQVRRAVFALLHEPPSAVGINRTTWRMADLTMTLRERGTPVCAQVVREITRSAGWRWRKARKVLTSNDPDYRAKVHHIQSILGDLQEGEAFFSVDEFGPFSVRAQGGRALVGPDQMPTVPQYQKSKGVLIMTAALELSQNQITHFYSPRKDTGEMLRMLARLVDQYKHKSQIYVSWDGASWHMSKMLRDHVAQHNERIMKEGGRGPTVALAPLPAGAQFLNVIESVFSGLARAILANSNYESIDQARAAIDRYIRERNEKFALAPKRAGGAIWGSEREPPQFSEASNCKDPLYR
jgi:transposase